MLNQKIVFYFALIVLFLATVLGEPLIQGLAVAPRQILVVFRRFAPFLASMSAAMSTGRFQTSLKHCAVSGALQGITGFPPTVANGPSLSGTTRSCGNAATSFRPLRESNIAGPMLNQHPMCTAAFSSAELPENQWRTAVP